jgi:hypothetical protein
MSQGSWKGIPIIVSGRNSLKGVAKGNSGGNAYPDRGEPFGLDDSMMRFSETKSLARNRVI